jgi:hypothetical protein
VNSFHFIQSIIVLTDVHSAIFLCCGYNKDTRAGDGLKHQLIEYERVVVHDPFHLI